MWEDIRCGARTLGGSLSYPLESVLQEVAYLAYYFHWPHAEIMALPHAERLRWVREVAEINKGLNDAAGRAGDPW